MLVTAALERQRKKNQEFKTIFDHIVNSRSAWASENVSKREKVLVRHGGSHV